MPLMVRLMAPPKVSTAKICCSLGPLNFLANARPIRRPHKAPKEKGAASDKSKLPETAEKTTPPPEMMASTPSEVATIDCTGRSV